MNFRNNDPLFWSRNAVRAYAAMKMAYENQMAQAVGVGKSGIVNPETGEVEPIEPITPVDPTDPTEPTDPTDPTDPTEPSEPDTPTEPVDPGEDAPSEDKLAYKLATANGNTISLDEDITLTKSLEITKDVELDLNKKTLTVSQDATTRSIDGVAAIVVKSGNLTLRNGTIVGTDIGVSLQGGSLDTVKRDGDSILKVTATTPLVVESGNLDIEAGTFTSTDATNGTAIQVESNNGASKSIKISNSCTITGVNAIKEIDAGGQQSNTTFELGAGTINGNIAIQQTKSITGGTYKIETITPEMIADGYVLANKSTTYTVVPETNIVAIAQDNEKFTTVEGAYKYIGKYVTGKTGTVTMVKDQVCNGTFCIDTSVAPVYNATVTIDFNGHKIISNCTRNGAVQIGKINGSVTPNITFKDSVGGGGVESASVVPIWVSAKAKLTIEGGTFNGGGAEVVYLQNAATCEIKGGTFKTSAVSTNTHDKRYILNRLDSGTGKFILSGGTYEFDVSTSMCGAGEVELAEGYTSRDNGDGTWTIVRSE